MNKEQERKGRSTSPRAGWQNQMEWLKELWSRIKVLPIKFIYVLTIEGDGSFMNEPKKIEELSKDIKKLEGRLNIVTCVLIIFVILSSITFIQSIFSAVLTNPALQFMIIATIGIALFVSVLVYIDIRLGWRENTK